MGTALGAALALTLAVLVFLGAGEIGTHVALRVTARWSYLWFWPAYAGGALATLFGPSFRPLAQRGREFGLCFAAAQFVHAGLVAWLYLIALRPPGNRTLLIFGVALFWTYLLAFFSIRGPAATLTPRTWKIIRTLGVEYIALAFLLDFAKNPFGGSVLQVLGYLPFLVLAIAAPILRLAALLQRLGIARRVGYQICRPCMARPRAGRRRMT
jgi:hypothetical protein